MKRKIVLLVGLFFLVLLLFVSNKNCGAESKKILMVIANNGFRDEEFNVPFEAFKQEGFEVVIASSKLGPAKGMLGMIVEPDILLSAAAVSDYDAVVFVGGMGAQEFWDDVNAQELAKSMYRDGKIVSAICIAPVILANAGVLNGKEATVWDSESNRLEAKGAQYTGKSVETDGNIITANGPQSAEEFAQEIIIKLGE